MSALDGQRWLTSNGASSGGNGGASTNLNELQRDLLSAADVVKQVQREVSQLTRENEALREELLRNGKGELTLRSSAGPTLKVEKVTNGLDVPIVAPAATGTPAAPTEPVVSLPLPFCPGFIEEAVNHEKATESEMPMNFMKSTLSRAPKKRGTAAHLGGLHRGGLAGSLETSEDQYENDIGSHGDSMAVGTERATTRGVTVYDSDLALRAMLFDPQTIKQKMQQNIIKADFNIARYYRRTGCAQQIVRSATFEHIKLVAILLNTAWIAIDTEHNRADVLMNADVGFQIPEHMFCVYFLVELLIRLAAFEKKRDCLRSGWFIFDALLVFAMVFEDWIMTIILLCSAGDAGAGQELGVLKNAAIIRILRVLRLARLGRAVKLMRQSPEVMIMVKALTASTRCVIWTCVVLACMIFFFGVAFTQMCKDSSLEAQYFPSLTTSLHTLLIAGLFPDLTEMSKNVARAHPLYWVVFICYLMMTTITILNLLIGVLVEVAQSSARIERDAMDVSYVKDMFVNALELEDVDDYRDIFVSKEEFAELLQDPGIIKALMKVGIDVFGLIDLMDFIFMRGAMGFVELFEVVLQLRSSADATVRDLVEVRKFLTYEINKLMSQVTELGASLRQTQHKTSEAVEWTHGRNGVGKAALLS